MTDDSGEAPDEHSEQYPRRPPVSFPGVSEPFIFDALRFSDASRRVLLSQSSFNDWTCAASLSSATTGRAGLQVVERGVTGAGFNRRRLLLGGGGYGENSLCGEDGGGDHGTGGDGVEGVGLGLFLLFEQPEARVRVVAVAFPDYPGRFSR